MKKILMSLIIGLTIPLTGLSAENLSKAFSKELAQTKAAGNNVTMINSMSWSVATDVGAYSRTLGLLHLLNTKEFNEFSTEKKVTVVNIYNTLSVGSLPELRKQAVKEARKILGNNAPITERDWRDVMGNSRGWNNLSAAKQAAFIKKKMSDPLPRSYVAEALTKLVNKERAKRVLLLKVFKGQTPTTLLLDSEGNVLNKTVFERGLTVKDYIEKYTEILEPEEEDDKEKVLEVKDKDAK